MSNPLFVPLHTGDTADDDGQTIDDFLIETDAPPPMLVEPIPAPQPVPAQTPNRVLSGYQPVNNLWDAPTLVLPADINRKHFHIRAHGTDVNNYVQVAGDKGDLAKAARMYGGDEEYWDDYTGPIWIQAVTGAVNVSYTAVTA